MSTCSCASEEAAQTNPAEKKNARTALVLGGRGLLGQALVKRLTERGWTVHTLDRADAPLMPDTLTPHIETIDPGVIFNTVAWTQVDDAEDHPQQALAVNRGLPALLGSIVRQSGAHLVHFSTDFVFNGRKSSPYTEEDATDPLCVYGSSKLAGEQVLLESRASNICVVRTAWLFGPGRKNFVSTILEKAKSTNPLKVVHDQIGSPTYTPDVADAAINLAERHFHGLVHVANAGQASWCELASEAVHQANIPTRVEAITTADWPQKASRPAYSVLDTTLYTEVTGFHLRTWPQALREYVFTEFSGEDKAD